MDAIILLFFSPLICVVIMYLLYDEERREKERERELKDIKPPEFGIYQRKHPSVNELLAPNRGKQEVVYKEIKPKTKLEKFLEDHGKQLAAYMEKDAFFIPISSCKDVAKDLIMWLNSIENVKYALLEEDGVHVEMRNE